MGSAEFVDGDSAEAVRAAVQAQMDIALLPSLKNIQLDWGLTSDAGDSQQSPYIFPLLANGKRFLMYYITSVRTPPTQVSLSASISGTVRILQFTVPQSLMIVLNDNESDEDSNATTTANTTFSTMTTFSPTATKRNMIHKMAGRSLIRDLEEGRSKFHALEKSSEEIRAEIVRLGLLYQIASSETSFLAIDEEGPVVTTHGTDGDEDDYEGGTGYPISAPSGGYYSTASPTGEWGKRMFGGAGTWAASWFGTFFVSLVSLVFIFVYV